MIRAYGSSSSGNCWKVAQILRLTETPFEWIEVDSDAGATRTPEFLFRNPNGKVPIVEMENGAVITESNAILLHYAEATRFLPAPGLFRTRVTEWLFFEQYSHEPYISGPRNLIAYQGEREKHKARLPDLWERGHKALAVMENRLSSAGWLTDAGFTIADIALFAYTHVAEEGEFDLSRYSGIRRWLDRVRAVPGLTPLPPAPRFASTRV